MLAIGEKDAAEAGRTRVFVYDGGSTNTWTQRGSDMAGEAAGDQAGAAIALDAAGKRLAAGAPLAADATGIIPVGHVRVRDYTGTSWVRLGTDINGESQADQAGKSARACAEVHAPPELFSRTDAAAAGWIVLWGT